MNKTSIEWCDYSVNPIRFRPHGSTKTTTVCQKVSPGCTACYSENIVRRFWSKDATSPFKGFTAQTIISGEFVLDEKQLKSVLKHKKPCRIFWCDMTDAFGEWVPFWMIDACFAVCALTPHITHMFLTKRPERMLEYYNHLKDAANAWAPKTNDGTFSCSDVLNLRHLARHTIDRHTYAEAFPYHPWPMPNIWVGTSCENQKYADERIPILCQIPAKVHFISAEPLIGEIDLEYPKTIWPDGPPMCCSGVECGCQGMPTEPPLCYGLSWCIVGGESGPKARPCHLSWIKSLVDQCRRWNISPFVKQLGGNIPDEDQNYIQRVTGKSVHDSKGGNLEEFPPELRVREFPGGVS